jgi:hypothetical protein
VLVKENYNESDKTKTDTVLHIVYWAANEELGYDSHFVIYGIRPKSKITGRYTPYRLKCDTKEEVHSFIKTIVSPDHNLAVELHQFYGYSDDSDDWYNIDWENTVDNSRTEIVAFDINPKVSFEGEPYLDFQTSLNNVLNIIVNCDIV